MVCIVLRLKYNFYIDAKIHGMSLICELQQNHLLSELMFQN